MRAWLMMYSLEPAQVTLQDSWQDHSVENPIEVVLAFVVQAGKFYGVLRLLVIPRLIGNLYSIFDMVDSQHRIATQRSEIFKTTEARKSSGPSPIAVVVLQKAKLAGVPSTTPSAGGHNLRTAQTMRFDLGGIDVGIFNENREGKQDAEFSRFDVGRVRADLRRKYTVEGYPDRDLELYIASVRWDTSDGVRVTSKEYKAITARQLIEKASTFKIPVAFMPSLVSWDVRHVVRADKCRQSR
jgi:hypothetical protein